MKQLLIYVIPIIFLSSCSSDNELDEKVFVRVVCVVLILGVFYISNKVSTANKERRLMKIAQFKFNEFEKLLQNKQTNLKAKAGSENFLSMKSAMSNGVEIIGSEEYRINDYLEYNGIEKVHNYYVTIEKIINDKRFIEQSNNYFKEISYESLSREVEIVEKKIMSNQQFMVEFNLRKLR